MTPINIATEEHNFDSINIRDNIIGVPGIRIGLSIRSTNISTLPPSISEFQEIDAIYITDTPIRFLPESIGDLPNLQQIILTNTSISALPESIGRLPLTNLTISNAPISALPDSIGNINNLFLTLINTRITALPNTVTNLHLINSNPVIPLSPRLAEYMESRRQIRMARLRQFNARQSRYRQNGHYRLERATTSFQSNIELLYSCVNKPSDKFAKIENIPGIKEWLDRILFGGNRTILAPFIIEVLEHAEKSDHFRERFILSIEASLGTCNDRLSLYINHIYMEKQLFCIDRTNSSELIKFLVQIAFPINLIDEIAAKKSIVIGVEQREQNYEEEIETYLAYLIRLNSRLSLGLPIQTMLYEQISKLNPEDIDSSEKFIRQKISDPKEYISFLIEHPDWIEFLQTNCKEEMKEIDTKANDIIDIDSESSCELINRVEEAKIFRKNYLKLLTLNHLNKLNN